jgi:hypothetical protein
MGGLLGEPTEREKKNNGHGNGHSNGHGNGGNGNATKRVIPVAPAQQGDEVFRIL